MPAYPGVPPFPIGNGGESPSGPALANWTVACGSRGPAPRVSRGPPRFLPADRAPTVLRYGPYRFFFFSNERGEPPHVHVQRDASVAKVWSSPPSIAWTAGFSRREARRVLVLVRWHRTVLEEAWHGYFGSQD